MKIHYLAGANSVHSYKWINFFCKNGYDVVWYSLAQSEFPVPDRCRLIVFNCGFRFLDYLIAIFRVKFDLARCKYSNLHVHSVGAYGLIAYFSNFKRLIVTPWGSDVIFGKSNIFKRFIIKSLLRRAHAITCDAKHMQSELVSLGAGLEKIRIINFGVDTERFCVTKISADVESIINRTDFKYILSTRNFEPVYDVATIIRAMPEIILQHPSTILLLIGRGSLKAELEKLVVDLNLTDKVKFLGYINNNLLPALLSNIDLYISTSKSDAGIAASTAEAMACECPVVITDSGENHDWIDHGKNGFLVKTSDSNAFATAICSLLDQKQRCLEVGKFARETIILRNDYTNEMRKVDSLYKNIFLT